MDWVVSVLYLVSLSVPGQGETGEWDEVKQGFEGSGSSGTPKVINN